MTKRWQYAEVCKLRECIRDGLKDLESDRARLIVHLKDQIRAHSGSLDSNDMLNCFLHILFGISYGSKYRLLSKDEIADLGRQAGDILKLQRIDFSNRRLGSLARDLYALLSQDARNRGCHDQSFWELAVASRWTDTNTKYRNSTKLLALALRRQRLGYVEETLESFKEVINHPDSEDNKRTAQIALLKGLRLSKNWQHHGQFAVELQRDGVEEGISKEASWELYCSDVSQNGAFLKLLSSCKNAGSEHYAASYLLEAMLWSFASPTKKHHEYFAQLDSIDRRKTITFNKKMALFCYCREFQLLLENSIPIEIRLRQAHSLFELRRQLPGLDHELLALLGLARFLLRNSQKELGQFVLGEYQALSLKCTGYKSRDALALGDGLFTENSSIKPLRQATAVVKAS